MYINCKTYFSFRYGTISTQELVQMAANHGVTSLALTNINCTCDTWDFVKYCREEKIKPITGAEIRNGDQLLYILLAANNKGLRWIHEFLSLHLMEDKPFPECCPEFLDVFVIYPVGKPVEELKINER